MFCIRCVPIVVSSRVIVLSEVGVGDAEGSVATCPFGCYRRRQLLAEQGP